jgi:hypothetical protein
MRLCEKYFAACGGENNVLSKYYLVALAAK